MHRQPALAFLVADAVRARILLRHGDGHFETLAEFAGAAGRRPRADTRGRVFAPSGASRSAVGEPEPQAFRRDFAITLAAAVDDLVAKGAVERLVLVAPARVLPLIREALGDQALNAIAGQMLKDLTKLPEDKLRGALEAFVLEATA